MAEIQYDGLLPIHRTDVYREVINRINVLIEEGNLKPGDRLPAERVLAESLGVSRTTLRQGIKVLESIGRLETRVGSGTYICPEQVPQISIQDIDINRKGVQDLIEARCSIELAVLHAFFARGRSPENLCELERLCEEDKHAGRSGKRDQNAGYKYNFRFEETIAAMAGNKILILQQQQIHALWSYVWGKLGFIPRSSHGHVQHRGILDALQENEEELACIYMRRHIDRDLDALFGPAQP